MFRIYAKCEKRGGGNEIFCYGVELIQFVSAFRIKLQIKDLKRVYSKIATDTIEQKNNILAKFALLFLPHDDVEDNPVNLSELDNSLNPLRELSSLMETPETSLLWLMNR